MRRVDLPSGGYLIIDYTEALTVVDVNSGSFTGRGKGGLEETITRVNTEAADEVVRQLRLRDIGGIIVIDFIDMARAKNRDKVLKTLRKALDADKSKSYVVEVSPLGLVEMTRQNITDGVREILTAPCPTCEGEGVVLSAETVALEGLRQMRDLASRDEEAFLLRVNPKVAAQLIGADSGLAELEEETGKQFHFEGGDALAIDTFTLIEAGSSCPDRGAGAAVQGRRGGAGDNRGAAHVQRRRRGRADRFLHRQRQRRRALCRRSQDGPDRAGRTRGGGRFAARRPCGQRLRARRSRIRRRQMSTYAVIESGGKQYKVEKGTSLLVDRLSAKEGDKVALRPVLFRDKEIVAEPKELEKVKVEATVSEHLRGPKIKVFKYKAKKGYRRRAGHRSELTRLEVTELKLGARKAAAKAEPKAEAKPKAAAKKPAEKKPASKKDSDDGS